MYREVKQKIRNTPFNSLSNEVVIDIYRQAKGDFVLSAKIVKELYNIDTTSTAFNCRFHREKLYTIPQVAEVQKARKEFLKIKDRSRLTKIDDVFSEWTPLSAYLFGVIAGDGSLHNKENRIRFCSGLDDKEYLNLLYSTIKSNAKITHNTNELGDWLEFSVFSRRWMKDLLEKGLTKNKNGNGFTLMQCPKHLWGHMLRGLYDTDGSIHKWTTAAGNVKSYSANWSTKHDSVRDEIIFMLNSFCLHHRYEQNNKGIWSIYCNDLLPLGKLLYPDENNLCLSRKDFRNYMADCKFTEFNPDSLTLIAQLYGA